MSGAHYEAVIGLEVHVQLKTQSKMFCSCATSFGADPNTHVCPVCLGYPGTMPVMNRQAIRLTVLSGLMLGCRINSCSKFDRKSYFYPDMPKNYQITQYDQPLCLGGSVEIEGACGLVTVPLTRIHLEEDVAKNMHFATCSGVDFNRAGAPLMEIVSEPAMHTPEEALAFLQSLKQMLMYAGVSDCNLEEGNMRCDVNISLRPAGETTLGTKAELKNLNSFKAVLLALRAELVRQEALLNSGERVVQETRRWDMEAGATFLMRTKEDAHDYRYFPEPDLMPVVLSETQIAAWARELPETPRQRRARFASEYSLPEYDARVLAADKAVGDYFEAAARGSKAPKTVSNWVMTEMLRLLGETGQDIGTVKVTPGALAELVELTEAGDINSNTARELFGELFANGGSPRALVAARGLAQVSDSGVLAALVDQAIRENDKSAEDYRNGKAVALKFLTGQVMRLSRGKANPQMAVKLLETRLKTYAPEPL